MAICYLSASLVCVVIIIYLFTREILSVVTHMKNSLTPKLAEHVLCCVFFFLFDSYVNIVFICNTRSVCSAMQSTSHSRHDKKFWRKKNNKLIVCVMKSLFSLCTNRSRRHHTRTWRICIDLFPRSYVRLTNLLFFLYDSNLSLH